MASSLPTPAADLVVTTLKKHWVYADQELKTHVSVTNNGPDLPATVTLRDALPVSVQVVSATPTQGICTASQTVTCSLGPLAVGATVSVTVVVRPIAPGSVTAVAASATSELPDSDRSNNSASLTENVRAEPNTTYVKVGDTAMTPATVSIPLGATVQWNFLGTRNHDVTDSTGLGLYASGSQAPDSYYRYTFDFAGGYSYASTEDSPGFGGVVKLAPAIAPTRGTTSMGFQLRWATLAPPPMFVFDVEIQRPGTGYARYLRGTGTQAVDFVPDAGNGTYRFRVQLRHTRDHASNTPVSSDAISVDPDNPLQWVHQMGAAGSFSYGGAIAVDADGNSYRTGGTQGTLPGSPDANAGDVDVFVAKYDADGHRLWVRELGTSNDDAGYGIAVDTAGNAYVTGETIGTLPGSAESFAGQEDAFVAKYDANGNRLWVHQLGSNGVDYGAGITVDADGNSYLTGFAGGVLAGSADPFAGGNSDAFVAKYDSAGNRLWVHEFGGAGYDWGDAIAVDAHGNAYLSGETSVAGYGQAFVAKYDTTGASIWIHRFGDPSTLGAEAQGIAVDADGNAYVDGSTSGTLPGSPDPYAGEVDVFVAKYDTGGNRLWLHQLGSDDADSGTGIAVDADRNVYLTGRTNGTLPASAEPNAGGLDVFVAKYDTGGNPLWLHQLGSTNDEAGEGIDQGPGIGVDAIGNAYVGSWTRGTVLGSPETLAGSADVFIAKYLTTG